MAGSGNEVRPTVTVLPLSGSTVTDLHLRPMFTTTIRLPEAVTSVAVGAPTLFEVEHSDQEPRLVFVNRAPIFRIEGAEVVAGKNRWVRLRQGRHTLDALNWKVDVRDRMRGDWLIEFRSKTRNVCGFVPK